MAEAIAFTRRATIGGDKGYDTKEFVEGLGDLGITPHIAAKVKHGAIDGRNAVRWPIWDPHRASDRDQPYAFGSASAFTALNLAHPVIRRRHASASGK